MPDDAWLVVGLGNPGETYARNRHNVGFMVVDLLAERDGARFKSHRAGADVVEGRLGGERVVLAKPRTYMNESGGPAAAVAKFYRTPVERLIVVHDDLDLDFGVLRVKQGGGEGGHNGLRSITRSLSSNDYFRIRCGIGRPPGRLDAATFVLKDFSPAERKELGAHVERFADAVESLVRDGLVRTQCTFHG